jgi:hypothetical protein
MMVFSAVCRAALLASRQNCCIGLDSAKLPAPCTFTRSWIATGT